MTFALFLGILGVHLLAAISPGPSFVMSVRVSATQGFRAAAGFALGLGLGAAIWAGAALFGLALIFKLFPVVHTGLKIAGGLFLMWIALQLWLHAKEPIPDVSSASPTGLFGHVVRGLATQLANPKPAVFFGAVFVGLVPANSSALWMVALLAFILLDETLWYVFVAYAFSRERARAAYGRGKRWADRFFGAMIGALGARIAIS